MIDESKVNPTSAGALAGYAEGVSAGASRPDPTQPSRVGQGCSAHAYSVQRDRLVSAQQASAQPSPEDAAMRTGAVGAPEAESTQSDPVQPSSEDIAFMQLAIEQARIAAALDEVPIGAVVVKDGQVIASACNRREIDADPAGHAEFLAMKEASRRLGVWRLSGCTVYVTLEPCLMCAGLMYQARIDRCVFGAHDPKAGALGSLYQVNADERLNHTFEVASGVCEGECAELLRTFFKEKRRRNKARKVQQ